MILRALMKSLILPPGLQIAGLALAWICWRRWPRLARALLVFSIGSLVLLSLPLVSGALMASLQLGYRPVSEASFESAQAIVILGGGRYTDLLEYGGDSVNARTLERLRYGARLQRASDLPILVTGGSVFETGRVSEAELMAAVLESEFGVPVTWIEGQSRTTAENAARSAELLDAAGVQRILLVTNVWHMQRAEAVFSKAGLQVTPAPLGVTVPGQPSLLDFVVSAHALQSSYYALHEWLGLLVYRWQGVL